MAVAIRVYCDGSGKVDSGNEFVTLAGYAGTPSAWAKLEKCWATVLARWSCSYLHMADANALRGNFSPENGWSADKVRGLLKDLFNHCLSPAGWAQSGERFVGAACTINLENYRRAYRGIPLLQEKEPEAICVDYVVSIALQALPEDTGRPLGKGGTVELYFDKKESFMHTVDRIWRSRSKGKLAGPLTLVSHISTANMPEVPGIQAADFLAWHTRRFHETGDLWVRAFGLLATPTYAEYFDYGKLVQHYGGQSGP